MPNCARNCGECGPCVAAHAQMVIGEKDAENAKLRAELVLMTKHAKEGWDLAATRARQKVDIGKTPHFCFNCGADLPSPFASVCEICKERLL